MRIHIISSIVSCRDGFGQRNHVGASQTIYVPSAQIAKMHYYIVYSW
ncbi:MAG: hypothetical protein ACLTYH_00750 [Streptococcus salivarius]